MHFLTFLPTLWVHPTCYFNECNKCEYLNAVIKYYISQVIYLALRRTSQHNTTKFREKSVALVADQVFNDN